MEFALSIIGGALAVLAAYGIYRGIRHALWYRRNTGWQ